MRMKENEGATVAEVEAARNCFLTVLHAEDVNIGENTDNTSLLFHGKALPPNCRIYRLPAEEAPSKVVHTPSVGHPPSYSTGSERPPLDPLKITHRIHTRIVFKEVCESLFQVRKLRDVLAMLRDAVKALQILHDAGWIHRDISPGNLLRIGNSVKISDLEYAKRLDSKDSHEVRTGTMDFMACEVEAQRYLFHKAEKRGKSTDIPSALGSEDRPPFRANSLHDLESLWWILAWILYFYVDQDGQEPSSKQQAAYGRMFPGAISGPGRLQALQGGLDVDIFTGAFLEVAAWADEMQTELFQAYRTSERTLPPKYTDAVKETTRYFLDALHNTVNLSGDTSLYDPLPPRKRKKAEGEKSNKRSKHDS
ncbi:hypothetical protein ID866_11754 [Astraeus odoratus]|nr:hypothetical protein ID866_11754 [Astraeus odoratus]